jgi:hypothetical protein
MDPETNIASNFTPRQYRLVSIFVQLKAFGIKAPSFYYPDPGPQQIDASPNTFNTCTGYILFWEIVPGTK